MKSNRAVGNKFEKEFCEKLFEYGFWVHNLKQDNAGQPADVIAVRNKVAYLIDCKDCSSKGFDLRRIEENQINAMQLWGLCGNWNGWFALKVQGEIYMITLSALLVSRNKQSSLSFEEIYELAIPLERWVSECE